MSKAEDQSKALAALVKKLLSKHKPELVKREPLEEFIYSFLIWEGGSARKAELALQRLLSLGVDLNELRTFEVADLVTAVGKTYPNVDDRMIRLKSSLMELYRREHEMSLEGVKALSKREGRNYLETLEGMPKFVAARICLIVLGGHAFPIDQKTLRLLEEQGVLIEGSSIDRVAASLERSIKAADTLEAHLALQSGVELGVPSRSVAPSRKKVGKKTTKKKASTTRSKGK